MKARQILGVILLLLIVAGGFRLWWRNGEPRRSAILALQQFDSAIHTADADALLKAIVLPSAIQSRTAAEQVEFLTKALHDEISFDGLSALRRDGEFGPLTNLFPAEAKAWAEQADVKPEDCVAFKLERNGVRAEAVLAHDSTIRPPNSVFRVVRCNNVKQLAKQ